MQEDLKGRKRIKTRTNIFALLAMIDVFVTVPVFVLLLQQQQLTQISTLVACIQLSNHEFLILITSWLTLRSGRNHFERIDSAGALMVIHFVTLIGNVTFLVFEAWPDYGDILKASLMLKCLLGWKLFFVIVEVVGMIYCYYIVHHPVSYKQINPRNSTSRNSVEDASVTSPPQREHSPNRRMQQAIQHHREDVGIGSILVHNGRNNNNNRQKIENRRNFMQTTPFDEPPPYTVNDAFEADHFR